MQKCDKCDKPATIHLTDIVDGHKTEVHLCEECAMSEGITVKASVPISQLLEDFVLQKTTGANPAELTCNLCGLTFTEFRKNGLLGCPHDYEAFEPALAPLLARAQEGSTQHVGKVPHRIGDTQAKQNTLLSLRSQLRTAVTAEDYERAAKLRDQIKELENS